MSSRCAASLYRVPIPERPERPRPRQRLSGGNLKLLLTSGGVTNRSIRDALVDLLGKPIDDSSALCIPTAEYGHPWCTPASAWRFIAGQGDFGWKSVGVLELTALPSIGEERWVPWVREADVLLVDGGDATYLCHSIRQSGLADLLATLPRRSGWG